MTSTVEESIAVVRARLAEACGRSGRPVESVRLVAITKLVPLELVRRARDAGIGHFGENYAKELAEKSTRVEATWHFVGKLQRGTVAKVVEHADVVHTAEPGHAIEQLAARAASRGIVIPCLTQVDFAGHRQGVDPKDVQAFVDRADRMEGISITGLMTVPRDTGDPEATRPYFARLRELRDQLQVTHPDLRELSMGMSGDYEVAVEEGATMVRVGTALFGPRPMAAGEA
jgi:pyridoxal phosphate enzyme (YggS family)